MGITLFQSLIQSFANIIAVDGVFDRKARLHRFDSLICSPPIGCSNRQPTLAFYRPDDAWDVACIERVEIG